MANVLSISDLNTVVDAEPRILDVVLGERLGFERPRVIRELIERNAAEVEGYGGLPQITANPGTQGGRPAKAYYLNEPQALLICMFSNTPRAAEVRHQVITVFMEYRAGKTVLSAPTSDPLARLAEMLDISEKAAKLDAVAVMLAGLRREHDQFTRGLNACLTAINGMVSPTPPTPSAPAARIGRPTVRAMYRDRLFTTPVRQLALEAGVAMKTVYNWRALANNDNKAA